MTMRFERSAGRSAARTSPAPKDAKEATRMLHRRFLHGDEACVIPRFDSVERGSRVLLDRPIFRMSTWMKLRHVGINNRVQRSIRLNASPGIQVPMFTSRPSTVRRYNFLLEQISFSKVGDLLQLALDLSGTIVRVVSLTNEVRRIFRDR